MRRSFPSRTTRHEAINNNHFMFYILISILTLRYYIGFALAREFAWSR